MTVRRKVSDEAIREALDETGGNVRAAARVLGIHHTTILDRVSRSESATKDQLRRLEGENERLRGRVQALQSSTVKAPKAHGGFVGVLEARTANRVEYTNRRQERDGLAGSCE